MDSIILESIQYNHVRWLNHHVEFLYIAVLFNINVFETDVAFTHKNSGLGPPCYILEVNSLITSASVDVLCCFVQFYLDSSHIP